jgi:hypothetical protein
MVRKLVTRTTPNLMKFSKVTKALLESTPMYVCIYSYTLQRPAHVYDIIAN